MINFKQLIARLENNTGLYAGFPPNTVFDYSELYDLLKFSFNNLGDPFQLKNAFSTHEYEREVIKWFLRLYSNDDTGWGYVTNGGTEGIIQGIWDGRARLDKPIIYYSKHAHYSIPKAAKLLNLESRIIECDERCELSYDDFTRKIIQNRDGIFVSTIGNTITSSVDDTYKIVAIFKANNVNYYIHGDAAIDGMVLPFINSGLPFKFENGLNSISISGHKVIGSPIPCGIYMTKESQSDNNIVYVRNSDVTIAGSRNGFTPLILWYAIKKFGKQGFIKLINNCISNAESFCNCFNENGISAWRYPHSINIVLDKLPEIILEKWHAPSSYGFTTLTALPKLTKQMVNEIISDYKYYMLKNSLPMGSKKTLYPCVDDSILLLD
jgi:histidine decarboxylase